MVSNKAIGPVVANQFSSISKSAAYLINLLMEHAFTDRRCNFAVGYSWALLNQFQNLK